MAVGEKHCCLFGLMVYLSWCLLGIDVSLFLCKSMLCCTIGALKACLGTCCSRRCGSLKACSIEAYMRLSEAALSLLVMLGCRSLSFLGFCLCLLPLSLCLLLCSAVLSLLVILGCRSLALLRFSLCLICLFSAALCLLVMLGCRSLSLLGFCLCFLSLPLSASYLCCSLSLLVMLGCRSLSLS